MTGPKPRIEPFGEGALLVTLGDRIDVELNRRAHRLAAGITRLRRRDRRFGRPVAGYATVLVPFDPLELDPPGAETAIGPLVAKALAAEPSADRPGDRAAGTGGRRAAVTIPVHYGGPDGPDLVEVAALHGLRPADVVELHAGVLYRVFMLGFAPGFGYLGPLPPELVTARRSTPRERVPAGSVAIAGEQTAVYPFATPGGWQLIGRTDRRLWDVRRRRPALLSPGDRVRFVPVG